MNALTDYGIMPTDHQNAMLNNEDIQLTTFLRKTLEKVGIKFAPDEEAQLFSFEHLCPGIHDGKLHKIFGHHSRFRTLLGENKMLWHLTSEQTDAISDLSISGSSPATFENRLLNWIIKMR